MFPIPPNGNEQAGPASGSEEIAPRKAAVEEGKTPLPEVTRSEVNFLVLPFFALWDKDVKKRTKIEYKVVAKRGNEKLKIAWTVFSNPEFGYPGPFDRAVHKAIEQVISWLPVPVQNPIPLGSLYNLCKKIGFNKFGGSQYRKIRESLVRIVATTIVSKGTFYSKEKEEWIEDIFHLYDRVIFKGKKLPNGEIADTNYLYLNSWYLDNTNANYVKPIDWSYYKSLKTPIAQRLYELLSVKFYGLIMKRGKFISYKYSTLCDLLPVAQQKYLSLAKMILDPAHKKLEETDFLKDWGWDELTQKGSKKDWLIKYYPGKRAKEEIERFKVGEQMEFELTSPREKKAVEDRAELSFEESSAAEQLIQRGITQSTARDLVKDYPTEQIRKQVEVFDWLQERKSTLIGKNPAGFLRKSIEENYQPPEEYLDYRDREAREQKAKDRRERWFQRREELIKQDIANWDKILPEERVKGSLDFWIAGEKLNGLQPTPEQMEVKKQELIGNLPKTDEEKWEYIARNYPGEPPEDFE